MKKIMIILSASFLTSAAFAQWTDQTSGVNNDLNAVYFTDNNTGWTVGRQGTILTTNNGGSTWSVQNSATTDDLNGVFMVNSSVGYAVGDNGKISKYNGSTWSAANTSETRDVFGVYFLDENVGWAVGDWGRLYYTSNGGDSWVNQNNDPMASFKYNDVYMLNASEGYAVGTSGRIAKFNGSNWAGQTSGVNTELLGVDFLNENFGFAVGKSSVILFYDGSNWSTHNSSLGNTSDNIYDVHIVSETEAYAVVSPGFGGAGIILKYNGSTWSKHYEFTGIGTELFYGIHFPNPSSGYAVGAGGMIKAMTTAGIEENSSNLSIGVYPNPSSGRFTIDTKAIVQGELTVFDARGVKVLESEISQQTTKEIDLTHFSHGIYTIRINDGNKLYTNKVVVQ